MEKYFEVRIPLNIGTLDTTDDDFYPCPQCSGIKDHQLFTLQEKEQQIILVCTRCRRKNRLAPGGQTTEPRLTDLTAMEIEENAELIPSMDLMAIIEEVINNYIPDQRFDKEKEFFVIRSASLIYFQGLQVRKLVEGISAGKSVNIYNQLNIEQVIDSTLYGVRANTIGRS